MSKENVKKYDLDIAKLQSAIIAKNNEYFKQAFPPEIKEVLIGYDLNINEFENKITSAKNSYFSKETDRVQD